MAQTDDKTLRLIEEVRRQEAEIAKLDHPTWKTNCSFAYVEGTANAINLHVESSVSVLVNIAAFLLQREEAYNKAAEKLGVGDVPQFRWGGFLVENWLEDLKTRIGKIQITSKRRKLDALKARLEQIISPELRAQLELEAIERELTG